MPAWYRWEGDELVLRLRVQPRASRDEWAGPHGDSYRVRITAPPVDGKANAHLLRLIARDFGVPSSRVRLELGETGREKQVRVGSPTRSPVPLEKS